MNKTIVKLSLLVMVLAGIFYWYEWRPHSIRMFCANRLLEVGKTLNPPSGDYRLGYELCLHQKGISK